MKGGAKSQSGLLGMRGSSSSTGPQEGLGAGTGNAGTPEDTRFKKDSLKPRELNPGQIVGTLPADEEAPRGDVSVPVRTETQAALQRMAEKVDTEVLPAEFREQVLRYMESLRAASSPPSPPEGAASSPASPPEGAAAGGAAGTESGGRAAEKGGQPEGR
jgi:hypothetical protein